MSPRQKSPARGVLKAFCLPCCAEWHIDMEEFKPGCWRSIDPAERNVTDCPDCGAVLTQPERIQPCG